MADIVKRLRAAAPWDGTVLSDAALEAADTIERLTRERDGARSERDGWREAARIARDLAESCAADGPRLKAAIEREAALRAEVDQYKAALEVIACDGCDEIGDYDCHRVTTTCLERGDGDPCHPCRARSALAGEGEEDG